ncbi:MAG: type II secretion system F family protein [Anaerolineales bacterium]|nr:type II secretion system F family protein [Anaerolineales bacterium]
MRSTYSAGDPVITILIIGGGLALILLIIGIIASVGSESALIDERLDKFLEEEKTSKSPREARGALTDWVNKRVEKSPFGDRIARELARADLKFKPGEYIALYVISITGTALVTFFLGGKLLVSALIGALLGAFIPRSYVKNQQGKRLQRFNDQLPDMLNLVVNGLRAGYSTMQALEAISREMPPPVSDEFRRVVQEMQLGVPMERALSNLFRRIPSEDLDFVITAINVQREVGGNLAEILDIISYTIRERLRIKGEIRVLTSQVMYSGRLLALMPVGLILILWFLNRDYMMTFFVEENRICGIIALGTAGLMIAMGYFIMTKLAKIEV